MFVTTRTGKREKLLFDTITTRNEVLCKDLDIDPTELSQRVIRGLTTGISTREIDKLSCESAINRSIFNPAFASLASRIAWNDLTKSTPDTFRECINLLHTNTNKVTGKPNPLIHPDIYFFAMKYFSIIEEAIDVKADMTYSYFAFLTLSQGSYLQKVKGSIVERGQYALMRIALGIHGPSKRNGIVHTGNIDKVLESYREFSAGKFTHATPTLLNAGTCKPQMSSCFLLTCPDSMGESDYNEDDSIRNEPHDEESIPRCIEHCCKISKACGGVGICCSRVRCRGAYIAGTDGRSNGITPLITSFNQIARYVDQGGGKRKGAFSIWIEPWHADVEEFLELRINTGSEDRKARDIFIGMWMPKLFSERVKQEGKWSLFCPGSYPELVDLYGEDFNKRYTELERQGKYVKQVDAAMIWKKILHSIEETGIPYMMDKDECNTKNNQKNIGTITSSNLCCEIIQYQNPSNIAVCNLASIALPKFVSKDRQSFDFKELGRIVEMIVDNLNMVIDKNYYPIKECIANNLAYRPMGIGVQGLADVFAMMDIPWEIDIKDSKGNPDVQVHPKARVINLLIFETIYYHAVKRSHELSQEFGSYSAFKGSPISQGILQCDMWNAQPLTSGLRSGMREEELKEYSHYGSLTHDWDKLRLCVKKGIRNSLLVALMPTGTTSQILGWNECFEPFYSNIFAKKVGVGNIPIVNPHLFVELSKLGKWTPQVVTKILEDGGSVQNLDIPQHLKNKFKISFELSQKTIVDLAADRGESVDQTQSMNIFMKHPSIAMMSSMYLYAIKKGLKTLSYYLRSLASVKPVQFSIMKEADLIEVDKKVPGVEGKKYKCEDDQVCTVCSS